MFPPGTPSTPAQPADFLPPDDSERDITVDYEMGGIALNDPSAGLNYQVWKIKYQADSVPAKGVIVSHLDGTSPTTIFNADLDVTELSLAFDQNMRPVIAYVEAGVCKLRWFDSVAGSVVTDSFIGVTSPFVSLDDKRISQLPVSDVMFVYVRDQACRYRAQKDRFTIEYLFGNLPTGVSRIYNCGMNKKNRFEVYLKTES